MENLSLILDHGEKNGHRRGKLLEKLGLPTRVIHAEKWAWASWDDLESDLNSNHLHYRRPIQIRLRHTSVNKQRRWSQVSPIIRTRRLPVLIRPFVFFFFASFLGSTSFSVQFDLRRLKEAASASVSVLSFFSLKPSYRTACGSDIGSFAFIFILEVLVRTIQRLQSIRW